MSNALEIVGRYHDHATKTGNDQVAADFATISTSVRIGEGVRRLLTDCDPIRTPKDALGLLEALETLMRGHDQVDASHTVNTLTGVVAGMTEDAPDTEQLDELLKVLGNVSLEEAAEVAEKLADVHGLAVSVFDGDADKVSSLEDFKPLYDLYREACRRRTNSYKGDLDDFLAECARGFKLLDKLAETGMDKKIDEAVELAGGVQMLANDTGLNTRAFLKEARRVVDGFRARTNVHFPSFVADVLVAEAVVTKVREAVTA